MSCDTPLSLIKGTTWRRVLTWTSEPWVYVPITAVPQLAPLRLTVVGHGMLGDHRCAITDVKGMRELNAKYDPPRLNEYHAVTVVDVDTVEINDISAASYRPYTSGGYIRYYTPVDMAGALARMDIKDRAGGTILHTLSTTLGTITIDNAAKTITLLITDESSEDFTWDEGVYQLEIELSNGEVVTLIKGPFEAEDEITTTETP